MIAKYLKNISFLQHKQFAVVAVVIGETNSYEVVIVNKENTNLSIVEKFTVNHIEGLKEKLTKETPVILSFTGKGIINKQVKNQVGYLKEILFNATVEDFYIYEVIQNSNRFVSLVRKEAIDVIFESFSKEGFAVIDYSIGPFIGFLSKSLIGNDFKSYDSELFFENQYLIGFQKTDIQKESFYMDDEPITNIQIPLFSSLIQHLYPSENVIYDAKVLSSNKEELKCKKVFDSLAIFFGIFFLLTLLISYLLLNFYNKKHVSYESELFNLNQTYNQFKKLESDKLKKQLILQQSGVLKEEFLTYYLYQITSSVPREISLTSATLNPIQKKIKNFEKISFQLNSIQIKGNSISGNAINEWINFLKSEKWVSKVEILDFSNSYRNKGEFTLKLDIK